MEQTYLIVSDQIKTNAITAIVGLEVGRYEVCIRRKGKTPPQRRYWHKCLSVMCEGTGYELIELKTIIKRQVFGTKSFTTRLGDIIERDISSEELSIDDYGKLIDRTITLAAMAGIPLPDPAIFGMELSK